MPAFLSQKGGEGERKENSPVDCFPRESYTGFSHNSRLIKRAGTFQLKHTSGTPKKAGAERYLLFVSEGRRRRAKRKQSGGTHYIKKVSHRFLIIQVLCCFLLFLLFSHMTLEVCFQIFRSERFDNAYAVVVDVDNLITLAVEVVSS